MLITVEGITISTGGTSLVLENFKFALNKNLQILNPLGEARGGAMAMATTKANKMSQPQTSVQTLTS